MDLSDPALQSPDQAGRPTLAELGAALLLSAFVIVGKPLLVMGLMGAMGYGKRASLLTRVTTAQSASFSLVLVALGLSLATSMARPSAW